MEIKDLHIVKKINKFFEPYKTDLLAIKKIKSVLQKIKVLVIFLICIVLFVMWCIIDWEIIKIKDFFPPSKRTIVNNQHVEPVINSQNYLSSRNIIIKDNLLEWRLPKTIDAGFVALNEISGVIEDNNNEKDEWRLPLDSELSNFAKNISPEFADRLPKGYFWVLQAETNQIIPYNPDTNFYTQIDKNERWYLIIVKDL